jgi:formylglycine-generating enzyme required for sulfatase activity
MKSSQTTAAPADRPTATFLLRQPRVTQGFRQPLAPAPATASLTLLWIPPGAFLMGSPQGEFGRSSAEGPQQAVKLLGFFMGQTPITQAQWREVAQWKERKGERWGRELRPSPSHFQPEENYTRRGEYLFGRFALLEGERTPDQRPVERVSWEEAIEFCDRLSQRTGRCYSLPSEAQWEYACRAGTTTPFAYGNMLTADLANYRASECYDDDGLRGEFRQQTTPVGLFPANAWGLHDMHGNVWEWCLDHWHESYEGAPADGSPWLNTKLCLEPGKGDANRQAGMESRRERRETPWEGKDTRARRLVRGGSWGHDPGDCRSAYRFRYAPDYVYYLVGFRVVCLPEQCPSTSPSNT